jgi:hypothetical protein
VAAGNAAVSGLDWDMSLFTGKSDHEPAVLR